MSNDDFSKSNDGELSPDLEARVVAWVLGEASAFEAAELERLCAQQPELAVFKRRMQAVHGLVGEATKPMKEPLRLSPGRRAKVLAVIGGEKAEPVNVVEPKEVRTKRSSWREWALPMAACFTLMTLLAAVIIPVLGGAFGASSKKPKRPDPSATVLGPRSEESLNGGAFDLQADRKGGGTALPVGKVQQRALRSVEASEHRQTEQLRVIEQQALQQVVDSGLPGSPPQKNKAETTDGRDTGLAETPEARSLRLGYQVVSEDVYAGPPVWVGMSGKFPQLPKSEDGSHSGVTVTAGKAQDYTLRFLPPGSRKLSDSERDELRQRTKTGAPNNPKVGDFYSSDSATVRLGSAASEAGRQRDMSPSADPFAAPPVDRDDTRDLIHEEKQKAKLVAKGRSQYLAGDIDGATETFRTLEAQAPESPEAKSFLRRIADERARIGELNRLKARGLLIQEVGEAWSRPSSFEDVSGERTNVTAFAVRPNQIIVPSVNFSGVGLRQVVSTLAAVSKEYDSDARGMDIVLDEPEGDGPLVTMTLRNLSLKRILDLVTASNGYRYEIVGDKVVVSPSEALKAEREKAKRPAFDPEVRAEISTAEEAVSTFSLHVSDASFRMAKAALARGDLPDAVTVRPEEFYNAFDYGDPAPVAGEAVACRVEQAGHPFLQQRNLVRVAMRVPAAGRGASQPLRLTVLLDTSGSMEREDRAATVRAALVSLAALLGPNDRVSLVGFARTPRLLAENVSGDQAIQVVDSAARTPAEGGTNMEQALALAGEIALRHKLAGAQNRIVLLTDGAANLGDADPEALSKRVEALRQNGIAFDACGIIADGLGDSVLEALTRKGDGRYTLLHSAEEADAAFAGKLAGAFRPAAKDVKVQVRFNPARVGRYRLIGFEQHRLKTEDFRNDAVDAAELAAEEAAVALYQVEVLPEGEGELGEVSVRFLETSTGQRVERSWVLGYVAQPVPFARATPSMQLAGSAAFLAEKLRGGALAGQVRLEEFAPVVEGLAGAYPESERVREFITMFRQARGGLGE